MTAGKGSACGPDVAVIGGGWSGIAAGWNLQRAGASVTLYDDQDKLGGRSAGVPFGPRTLTAGGKNLGRKYENFRAFAKSLGCEDYEFHGINSSRAEGENVQTFDSTRRASSFFGALRRLPPRDTLRLLRFILFVRRRRENSFCGGRDFVRLAERAGNPFLSEYFGEVIKQIAIRPLTVRMNGAEPDEVPLECFGTHLGMLLDSFDQLTSGFEDLFGAFAEHVAVRNGTKVTGLTVESGRVTGLVAQEGSGGVFRAAHDAVVVALPAPAAADLLEPLSADLTAALRAINYFPAAVVLAEYDRPVFGEQVRARVFPADSPLSNAGAYGLNDRHIVRYTFSGRAYRTADLDETGLLDLAEALLAKQIDLDSVTRVRAVSRSWIHAYCGYSPLHSKTIQRLDRALQYIDGIALTGDYLRGVSIEGCFRAAFERTDSLMARL
jgi:oxygen-dependent protoporphyrinogen oxidase